MKKINLLIISGISAMILFVVLTFVQGKIINNENHQVAYVADADILKDTELNENKIKEVNVPSFLINNTTAIVDYEDIKGKYAKYPINKGQIIFKQDIASKEELKIINSTEGLEKISVKIKSSENGVSYQVKPQDRIHLYFTGKHSAIKDAFMKYGIEFSNSENNNSLHTSKIIHDIEVLGIYDELGRSYNNANFSKLDTIVIAVEPMIAELINNLRSQGTFDITR